MDEKIIQQVEVKAIKIGRPKVDANDKIGTNNLSARQWKWIQKEAKLKHIDGAQLQRQIVDWYIDSVEASRTSSIATEKDDHQYERLVKPKKRKRKANKSSK